MQQFFWVNQGATHNDEVASGCLWAPERDANGSTLVHWESMTLVRPGDVIFAYANGQLRGHAIASSIAAPMPRPYASGTPYSPAQGGRVVFCDYAIARDPIPLSVVTASATIKSALSGGPNPVLNSVGGVAQKYLCLINPVAGEELARLLGLNVGGAGKSALVATLDRTTVRQLIDARLGQGSFRSALLVIFDSRCPVTGLMEPMLLRASHIRPWCESSNAERLDPENGLLLAAGLDAAFDCGFVGFDQEGRLLVKGGFSAEGLKALGIPSDGALPDGFLTSARRGQLDYHRTKFRL